MRRLVTALVVALAGALLLSGCSFDVYKLPLPGGTDVGSHPITVTADFQDVLDLVPKSTVKVNDVSVGEITNIKLVGYHAVVTMKLRSNTKLPDNTFAQIQQTSLLGEKFIALSAPTSGASGRLANGDVIPLSHTGRDPEVEEVLGALSLLLNGGGVAQLKTIASEINTTLTGREDPARDLLTQVQTLATTLDTHKSDIVNAIDALNRLSLSIRKQQGNIDEALDELPSALRSIDTQRADLVKMLQALSHLGNVGVRVIKASKQATIDSITQLQPVLTELAASGDSFVKAFNVFLTYPFVDEVVGRDPQVARNLQVGDYTNLSVDLDLDLTQGLPTNPSSILPSVINPTVIAGLLLQCIQSGSLASPACQQLLATPQGLANLKADCQKPENQGYALCQALNQIPGLPTAGASGNTGSSGLPTALPSGLLPTSLPSLPGLGRAGPKGWASPAQGGPTMGQLESTFDPSLVNLMIPPMVTSGASATKKKGGESKK